MLEDEKGFCDFEQVVVWMIYSNLYIYYHKLYVLGVESLKTSGKSLFQPPTQPLKSPTSIILESEVKQKKKLFRPRVYSVNAVSRLGKAGQRQKQTKSPLHGIVNPILSVAPSTNLMLKPRAKSFS